MRHLLIAAFAVFLVVPSQAQTQWNLDSSFSTAGVSGHGIAVDAEGKIWWQPFSATDSIQVNDLDGAYYATRAIHIFNPDGSESTMSPLKVIDFGGGVADTLGGYVTRDSNGAKIWDSKSGRGLTSDGDGNIIISAWKWTYKVNHQTGAGMARSTAAIDAGFCALTAAAAASESGNVFVAAVCPGAPIIELASDLSIIGNAVDESRGFARSFAVSPNGNKIYWAGYTNLGIDLYERADEFSAFDSLGFVIPGMSAESFGWQPVTGYLWVSSGSPNDLPNRYTGATTTWLPNAWYGFDPAELAVDTVPVPKVFFQWSFEGAGSGEGRPRGIAFSPDGSMAYVTQFSQTGEEQVQVFSATAVNIETVGEDVPTDFVLMQAYPNPFNPTTNIEFSLAAAGHANLAVFDVQGREVSVLADQQMAPGTYRYQFDAAGLPSGVYLYRLQFEGQVMTGRMTLLK